MSKLVKLPDGTWVNPEHVTCIEYKNGDTRVWVKKDAGYGTGSIYFDGSDRRDELATIINGPASAPLINELIAVRDLVPGESAEPDLDIARMQDMLNTVIDRIRNPVRYSTRPTA